MVFVMRQSSASAVHVIADVANIISGGLEHLHANHVVVLGMYAVPGQVHIVVGVFHLHQL